MDHAVWRGKLEVAVEGDADRIADLALDIRSILMGRRAGLLQEDLDHRVAVVLNDWPDFHSWREWLEFYDQEVAAGRAADLLSWLQDGAPEVITLPESEPAVI